MSQRSPLIFLREIPLQVNEAVNVYTRSKLGFFFSFPRHTLPLDQSLKAQTWKGRTFSKKITQVQWRIVFATPNLFVPHFLTPLSGNTTFSHMQFFGLPFQIQKIFNVLQGRNLIFLCIITTRWVGLEWHQRRPVVMTCSDRLPLQSQVKCSVFAQGHCSLCLGWRVLLWHTRGNRWECGGRQNVCKNSWWAPQLHRDLAISLWLTQPCLSAGQGQHTQGWTRRTPQHSGHAWALAASGVSAVPGSALGPDPWCQGLTASGDTSPSLPVWPLCSCCFLATAHNIPPRSNSSGAQQCFKGASWLCLKWWGPLSLQWVSQLPNLWPFSHIISCHKDNVHLNGDKSFYKLFGPLLFHLPGLLFKRFYFVFQLFIYFRLSGMDEKILSICESYR